MPNPPYTAHVVSHTHWDREWYRTFQLFRMRLVAMTDAMLDLLETNPDYKYFYWDGQTVVIEDYLEICPENADRLRRHFSSGKLYTGPWFIQPDEFLVSGEAFVRNLLLGRKQCREWGTGAEVGYAPDAFGHISQMPQILQGFGIDNAVLFRGITTDHVDSEFLWRSPDGSEVLCVKMPDENAYSNFFYRFRESLADTDRDKPLDQEQVVKEATALLEDGVTERPTTHNLLWMDGVDHIFTQPRTPEIISIVNARLGEHVQVRHSTLPDFLAAVRAAKPDLKAVTGELRVSNRKWKLQALLTHVASSRIHLKQLNHQCETLLERWAEPWSAIAWSLGAPYPDGFLQYAWKQLLLNQPHDSICGCSIDAVHRDMLPRYEQCLQVGEKLAADAMTSIAARVDTNIENAVASLVVFNPLGWERNGNVVEAVVDLPTKDAPEQIALITPDGKAVPCSVEKLKGYNALSQAPHDIPVGEQRKRWKVRFPASVPAFGYQAYAVSDGRPPSPFPQGVEVTDNSLENEFLRAEVAFNGSINLTDKLTGQVYRNGLLFEDGGDFGDGYNYRKPKEDKIVSTVAEEVKFDWGVSDATAGRLRYVISWNVPAGRSGDSRAIDGLDELWIQATLSLAPGSKRLDIHLDVTNYAKDHRLRALFPTGLTEATHSHADQAYDVVSRPIAMTDCTDWKEPQPPTAPQKSFVDVNNGQVGLCLINRGIPEYEVKDDKDRTIALTLLRCTGNGVGTPEEQEEGQMQGTYGFDFALYPHAGDWETAKVWQEAHNFNVPLRAAQTSVHTGDLPASRSFLSISPDPMFTTAVKRSEDGRSLVLRAVNYGSEAVTAEFGNALGYSSGQSARMDETVLQDASAQGETVTIEAPAHRVVTLLLNNGASA